MRSNLSVDKFFEKAKKTPSQMYFYLNVETLTDDEIDNSSEPMWVKKALKLLRSRRVAENIAKQMMLSAAPRPEQMVNVFQWNGGSTTLAPVGSLSLDIENGDLFYFKDDYAKVNNYIVKIDDNIHKNLLNFSTFIGTMTANEYSQKVNQYVAEQICGSTGIQINIG